MDLPQQRIRIVSHLSVILVKFLENAGLYDALQAMEHTQRLSDGVRFLNTIRDSLMPSITTDILKCIEDLLTCVSANSESLDFYYARLEHIWIRIEHQKCLTIEDLRLAFLQRGVLNSVYQNTECLNYFKTKVTYGNISLRQWDKNKFPCRSFLEKMRAILIEAEIISKGKMSTVPAHFGRAAGAIGSSKFSTSLFGSSNFLTMGEMTKADADKLFEHTNCPIC